MLPGWSGSGGDCFPWLFRESKLGPLIGTRTGAGLSGDRRAAADRRRQRDRADLQLYDGSGQWIIESHGVDPDIEVIDDPSASPRAPTRN